MFKKLVAFAAIVLLALGVVGCDSKVKPGKDNASGSFMGASPR